jgi:hypothetical protein
VFAGDGREREREREREGVCVRLECASPLGRGGGPPWSRARVGRGIPRRNARARRRPTTACQTYPRRPTTRRPSPRRRRRGRLQPPGRRTQARWPCPGLPGPRPSTSGDRGGARCGQRLGPRAAAPTAPPAAPPPCPATHHTGVRGRRGGGVWQVAGLRHTCKVIFPSKTMPSSWSMRATEARTSSCAATDRTRRRPSTERTQRSTVVSTQRAGAPRQCTRRRRRSLGYLTRRRGQGA